MFPYKSARLIRILSVVSIAKVLTRKANFYEDIAMTKNWMSARTATCLSPVRGILSLVTNDFMYEIISPVRGILSLITNDFMYEIIKTL